MPAGGLLAIDSMLIHSAGDQSDGSHTDEYDTRLPHVLMNLHVRRQSEEESSSVARARIEETINLANNCYGLSLILDSRH